MVSASEGASLTHALSRHDVAATNLTSIGIVGSGIMAAGIAEVIARAGLRACVRGRTTTAAAQVIDYVSRGLSRQVEKGKLDEAECKAILSRIDTTDDLRMLAACDIVIESIVEDFTAKAELLTQLDQIVTPSTILATNTSTLSVGNLGRVTSRPDRFCGIHFFNPATVLTLVEVVRSQATSEQTITRAREFVGLIGKEAVDVQDRAGFIVNALLFPYLNNAIRMLEMGTASMNDIDIAMKGGCNFPMGPFALLDLVGLDTALAILETLHREFGDENFAPRPMLRDLVANGRLGRKSKAGFYVY